MLRAVLVAVLLAGPAIARSEDPPPSTDLTSIGLEDLLRIHVTSVSLHEEPQFRAASAITVLTGDDIARSGVSNIPDLLRTVPGMNVAQINANTWAVSSRGFGGQYANKMLVLVDGRTVYNAIFSGVYWDVLDLALEDLDRIEVIRGPGATAWGANAVNGVINIITKPATAGRGVVATAAGGSHMARMAGYQFAGPAGASAAFRVFGKFQDVRRELGANDQPGHDAMGLGHAGARLDWQRSARDEITFQGEAYGGTVEQKTTVSLLDAPYAELVDFDSHLGGGNLMASWQREFSSRSEFRLHSYVDRVVRPGTLISQDLRTFAADFQHRFAFNDRNDLTWGGGYRAVGMIITGSSTARFARARRTTQLGNLFVQDAIALWPPAVTLTLGSKIENDGLDESELEPSARLLWVASPTQTVWGAVSRAVRTPGPADEDIQFDMSAFPSGGVTAVTRIYGAPLRSETLTAMELGYRAQVARRLSIDLAGFECRYADLRGTETGTPFFEVSPAPAHLVIPLTFANSFSGRTRGLEATIDWRPNPRLELNVSHSLFWMRLDRDAGSTANADVSAGDAPTYQMVVRPHVVLPSRMAFDATWLHVDDLPAEHALAYDRVDAHLSWNSGAGLELSAGVQNLFHDGVAEFANISGTNAPTVVRTGAYGKVAWRP